jgi:carbamoyl-phosphate synthase large subunit
MKATGEVMSIGTNLEAALLKAIRSLEENIDSLILPKLSELSSVELREKLKNKDSERLWVIAESLRRGISIDEIYKITLVDEFFLSKIDNIVKMEKKLQKVGEEFTSTRK